MWHWVKGIREGVGRFIERRISSLEKQNLACVFIRECMVLLAPLRKRVGKRDEVTCTRKGVGGWGAKGL